MSRLLKPNIHTKSLLSSSSSLAIHSRSFSNVRAVSSQPWNEYVSEAPKHDAIHRLLKNKAYINGQVNYRSYKRVSIEIS